MFSSFGISCFVELPGSKSVAKNTSAASTAQPSNVILILLTTLPKRTGDSVRLTEREKHHNCVSRAAPFRKHFCREHHEHRPNGAAAETVEKHPRKAHPFILRTEQQ